MSSTSLSQAEWNAIFDILGKAKLTINTLDADEQAYEDLKAAFYTIFDDSDVERDVYTSFDKMFAALVESPAARKKTLINWIKNTFFPSDLVKGKMAIIGSGFAAIMTTFADRFDDDGQVLTKNTVTVGTLEGDEDNTGLVDGDKNLIFTSVSAGQDIVEGDTVYVKCSGGGWGAEQITLTHYKASDTASLSYGDAAKVFGGITFTFDYKYVEANDGDAQVDNWQIAFDASNDTATDHPTGASEIFYIKIEENEDDIQESGDDDAQFSTWAFSGATTANTDGGDVYIDLAEEEAGSITEFLDDASQLSSWVLTGQTVAYSDWGRLYCKLYDTAGDRYVELYKDSALGADDKVSEGHRTGDGSITLSQANGSGISGSVTVAYTADDSDIYLDTIDFTVKGYKDSGMANLVCSGTVQTKGEGTVTLAQENASGLTGSVVLDYPGTDDGGGDTADVVVSALTWTVKGYTDAAFESLVFLGRATGNSGTETGLVLAEQNSSGISGTVDIAYSTDDTDITVTVTRMLDGDEFRWVDTTNSYNGLHQTLLTKDLETDALTSESPTVTEAGDGSDQMSGWELYGVTDAYSDSGKLYGKLEREPTEDYDDSPDIVWGLRYSTAYVLIGIRWTQDTDRVVYSAKVKMYKAGSPSGDVWCTLQAENDQESQPSGSALGTSAKIDASTLTADTDGAWYELVFASPVTVEAGKNYYIVLTGDWAVSSSNYVGVKSKNITAHHTYNGNAYSSASTDWSFIIGSKGSIQVLTTNRRVELYKESGRTTLTADGQVTGDGEITLAEVDSSGVNGRVTVAYTEDDVDWDVTIASPSPTIDEALAE